MAIGLLDCQGKELTVSCPCSEVRVSWTPYSSLVALQLSEDEFQVVQHQDDADSGSTSQHEAGSAQ